MIKYLFVVVLFLVGTRKGCLYLNSDQFQKYGDEKKAQWTCHVNDILAETAIFFSKYTRAEALYQKILTRCPETGMAEKALYKIGTCYEGRNLYNQAIESYENYLKVYPDSGRSKKVLKKIQVLQVSR